LQREKAKEYRQKQESNVMQPKDDPLEKVVDFENVVTETAQKGDENVKSSGMHEKEHEIEHESEHGSDLELTKTT